MSVYGGCFVSSRSGALRSSYFFTAGNNFHPSTNPCVLSLTFDAIVSSTMKPFFAHARGQPTWCVVLLLPCSFMSAQRKLPPLPDGIPTDKASCWTCCKVEQLYSYTKNRGGGGGQLQGKMLKPPSMRCCFGVGEDLWESSLSTPGSYSQLNSDQPSSSLHVLAVSCFLCVNPSVL